MEVASILTDDIDAGGKITVFTVDTGGEVFDVEGFIDRQVDALGLGRNRFVAKIVKAKSPVTAILGEARNHDLVVLGTTRKSPLSRIGRQSVPEMIACRCAKPVAMVKSDVGVTSWIKKWI
ncbi:MAG: universal stress protein [Planctomycetes bacterium]|nr:universal stress protein [Planctomycetota bacterium]